MVEMRDADGRAVVGGRSRDKCVMLDVDDTQLPLKWENVSEPVALGTRVTLRIYFRDATIFAVGSGEERCVRKVLCFTEGPTGTVRCPQM